MSTKTKLILITFFTITFVGGVGAYIVVSDGVDLSSIIMILASLLLFVFIYRKLKAYKDGVVLEDELSDKLRNRAGARSFYMSLYLWLILGYVYDFDSEVKVLGVGGMAILFALNYFVLARGKQ